MARLTGVTLTWGDGSYTFDLMKLSSWREYERKCDCGLAFALRAMEEETWRFDYVREAIRIGLVGGGVNPSKAVDLVKRYVDEVPMFDNLLVARAIISAALAGLEVKDDPLGKSQGEAAQNSPRFPGAKRGGVASMPAASS